MRVFENCREFTRDSTKDNGNNEKMKENLSVEVGNYWLSVKAGKIHIVHPYFGYSNVVIQLKCCIVGTFIWILLIKIGR